MRDNAPFLKSTLASDPFGNAVKEVGHTLYTVTDSTISSDTMLHARHATSTVPMSSS